MQDFSRFQRFERFVEAISYVFSIWALGSIPPAGTIDFTYVLLR
jgi:hypothetical protein